MITLTDFKELQSSLELDLYELLDTEMDGLQLTIVQEQGNVVVHLQDEENEAFHMMTLSDFKSKNLKNLNNYINHVWYYNQQEKY